MLAFYCFGRLRFIAINPTLLLSIALISYVSMSYLDAVDADINRIYSFGVPSLVLVLAVTLSEKAFNMKFRLIALLSKMGDASYATYLSHFYIVEGIRKIVSMKWHLLNISSPAGVFIVVVISLIVGQIIYSFVDKPLSSLAKRIWLSRI
jgi:peptidoglycan/LPS O-acetylase OafA/YrhL